MTDKEISTEYTGVYTAVFPAEFPLTQDLNGNKTPREIELESHVKELEEENKLLKSQLDVARTSLVFIREISRDLYSSRRATQTLQRIRQMEKQAKDDSNDR